MGKEIFLQKKINKMSTRPTVSVFSHANPNEVHSEVQMPHVFCAPVRNDIVSFVHDQLSRNSLQARGVDRKAGMKHSAESWGTGRAVARIPRVSGSGTHRSGQAAFGNMCRKGRMAHPLQTFRRWHRRVKTNKGLRSGKGKMRDMRHKWRRGPLFIVDEGCESLRRALRNVPGCDMANVNRLNIRQLAPC